MQAKDRRVHRFLDRHREAPAFRWDDVTDPRDRRGRRWQFETLLDGLFDGMLAGCRTLRDLEALTDEMGDAERARVPRRIPDTTLYELDGRAADPPAWRRIFDWVRQALRPPGPLPPLVATG